MKNYMKSSCRVKADPEYYRKKHAFWCAKRDRLMEKAGRNLDVQPATEPPELTNAINTACDKAMYYSRMIPVAARMAEATQR